MLPVRRERKLYRGLLHCWPDRTGFVERAKGRSDHLRPAADLEHARYHRAAWGPWCCLQKWTCLHQREDALGECDLWRRDERSSLLPRSLVLRQRHDSVSVGRAISFAKRPFSRRSCRRDDRAISMLG